MAETEMMKNELPEVFFDLSNGEYVKIDMSLPLQILFDDVMTFVSETEL